MVAIGGQVDGFSAGAGDTETLPWSAVAVRLGDVVSRPTEWLWEGRIPLGKLTLLAGDPGLGKSFLTVDLAARVTSGKAWPDGAAASAGSVIFLNAEDELQDTLCPRLQKAGADLDKCIALTALRSRKNGLVQPLSLAKDLAAVRQILLETPDCKLIVIDPISAYMGYTDSNSNTEVRSLLFPLAQLAAEFGVAVVAVTHLNKRGAGRALYRAMGSLAFVAAARSAWTVVRDPEDKARHLLLPVKSNLGELASGLAYRFEAESTLAVAKIAWEAEPVEAELDELLDQQQHRRRFSLDLQKYRDAEHYADTWLRQQLENGPCSREHLFDMWLRPVEISEQQVYRAAERLGVVKVKETFANNSWLWSLPEDQDVLLERRRRQRAASVVPQAIPKAEKEEKSEKNQDSELAEKAKLSAKDEQLERQKRLHAEMHACLPRARMEMLGLIEEDKSDTSEAMQELRKMARFVSECRKREQQGLPVVAEEICAELGISSSYSDSSSCSSSDTVEQREVGRSVVEAETAAERSAVESVVGPQTVTVPVERARGVTTERKLALMERLRASLENSELSLSEMSPDAAEELLGRLEWRLDRYLGTLKRKGRHLTEKAWTNFCAELRPKERTFLDENWNDLKDHFYELIAKTPLGATIRQNNGQWPNRRFADLTRTNQRIEKRYRHASPRTPME